MISLSFSFSFCEVFDPIMKYRHSGYSDRRLDLFHLVLRIRILLSILVFASCVGRRSILQCVQVSHQDQRLLALLVLFIQRVQEKKRISEMNRKMGISIKL